MKIRNHRRGFTLIELLVGSSIAIMVLTAAMMGFQAQNQALLVMDMAREGNGSAQDALLKIESTLRRGGWGVDPRYAFDFDTACMAASPGCRDSATGSDQLVVLSRDPRFEWTALGSANAAAVTCATAGGCFDNGYAGSISAVDLVTPTLTATFPVSMTLQKGQLLLATCLNGQSQVLLTLSVQTTVIAGAPVVFEPETAANPPYNDTTSLTGCHQTTGAALYLVDRSRFMVHTFTASTTPWLVLDPMLDSNGDTNIDEGDYIPIAENVEGMQVAYMLQPTTLFGPPDTDGDWIIGNDPTGVNEEPNPAITPEPTYTTIISSADRYTLHPANVRAVRVTLVVRSARTDPTRESSWTGDSITGAENTANITISGGRFRRYVSTTEVTLRNMGGSAPFVF